MALLASLLRRQATPLSRKRSHVVDGRDVPLIINENKRAKRMTLRLQPSGRGLKLTVPPGLPESEIDAFLLRHQGWVEARLRQMPDEPTLKPGMKVPIRGVPHMIVHRTGRGTSHVEQGAEEPALVIFGDQKYAARRVADFLKAQARNDIEKLVAKHTATIGRRAKSVRFRDTSSRWGSCSASGNLSFSWRIMMAPPNVIDYLVAHEVAHLKEMNHSKRFWDLCEKLCPDTKRCKDWLKRNGEKLQAIGFERTTD